MSSISKLSIQGIRSFDSNDRETIEFGKPLTLIAGTNGSGKTTIIECLKYATTGDLPPNSKGGAFIHDPKITGEKDVRAQVKLSFLNAQGARMVVTRNIQLLVKKTSNTFKTLEGQLVVMNKNEKSTISTRCAELDTQVPLHLGVPKAILDYVIFCHQEDSLWPLSEPANLKKRFDEIFQALKFTKALDNLKVIRKDMAVDVKLLKQSVAHLKTDKERSVNTKKSIESLERQKKQYSAQVEEYETVLEQITARSDMLFKSNQEFQKVLSKLDSLNNTKRSLKEQISRLESSIELIDLPEEKLQDLLDNFAVSLEDKQRQIEKLKSEYIAQGDEINKMRDHQSTILGRQGQLIEKQTQNVVNIETRRQLYETVSKKYNLECDIQMFCSSIQEKLKLKKDEFQAVTQYMKKLEKDHTQKLNDSRSTLLKEEQHFKYAQTDLQKMTNDLAETEVKAAALKFTKEDLQHELSSLEEMTRRLDKFKEHDYLEKINSDIKLKNDNILIVENELETLQSQILKANKQSDLYAKLSLLKMEVSKKKEAVTIVHSKFKENSEMFGDEPELNFKKYYLNLQKKLAVDTKTREVIQQNYTRVLYQLEDLKANLQKLETDKQQTIEKVKETLDEVVTVEEYKEILKEADESYRIALENLKMHHTTLEFNQRALQIAKHDGKCYLCQRGFDDDSMKDSLIHLLEQRTNSNQEVALQQIVEETKQELAVVRSAENEVSKISVFERELKSGADELLKIEHKMKETKLCLDNANKDLEKVKEDIHKCEDLRPLVNDYGRLCKDAHQAESDLKTTTDELAMYGSDLQTIDELQELQKLKNNQLRQLRKDIGELMEEKEFKNREFSTISNAIREKEFKISEIEGCLRNRENLLAEKLQAETSLERLKIIISNSQQRVEDLKSEVQELQIQNDRLIEDNNSKESCLRSELDELANTASKINSIEEAIITFETKDRVDLESITTEISSLSTVILEVENKLNDLSAKLNTESNKLSDAKNEERNLNLNIELRKLKKELVSTKQELSKLDIQNAESERDRYQEESTKLRVQYDKVSAENAGLLGEMKQLENQIKMLHQQLQTEYKNIDDVYHREWVKLQTKTIISDDIDTYSKALDSAIMKYHSVKMREINRIVDELWKSTYRGTDVDTIMIKSDEATAGQAKGKSYNYRVVMFKQDVELDMRGRCSAGQKVLACIIIRLALSETFGQNCGVITLDEPTTNLDQENIESLANSLSRIIEARRHQKNFQLIVITHDEKFLTHMNAANFTDHFYRVMRDDRQKSLIQAVNISQVSV